MRIFNFSFPLGCCCRAMNQIQDLPVCVWSRTVQRRKAHPTSANCSKNGSARFAEAEISDQLYRLPVAQSRLSVTPHPRLKRPGTRQPVQNVGVVDFETLVEFATSAGCWNCCAEEGLMKTQVFRNDRAALAAVSRDCNRPASSEAAENHSRDAANSNPSDAQRSRPLAAARGSSSSTPRPAAQLPQTSPCSCACAAVFAAGRTRMPGGWRLFEGRVVK